MFSISLTLAQLALGRTQLGEAEMKNRIETSGGDAQLFEAGQPDYFELFRSFNSEGSFLEFARQLRQEPVSRWQENARAVAAG
jgi:hypothetical protein